jgi:sentrin-specific protease 1
METQIGMRIGLIAKTYSVRWNVNEISANEMSLVTDKMGAYNGNDYIGDFPDAVIRDKYQITIYKADFSRLSPGVWLNDQIINFYFEMISELHHNPLTAPKKKFHFFNSFFYSKLTQNNVLNLALRKDYRTRRNVFEVQLIFIPINIGNYHWVLVIVDMHQRKIKYYDSMFSHKDGTRICGNLLKWLSYESEHIFKEYFNLDEWTTVLGNPGIPQQINGFDCGVFVIMFADLISRGLSVTSLDNLKTNIYRYKIALLIITGDLYEL